MYNSFHAILFNAILIMFQLDRQINKCADSVLVAPRLLSFTGAHSTRWLPRNHCIHITITTSRSPEALPRLVRLISLTISQRMSFYLVRRQLLIYSVCCNHQAFISVVLTSFFWFPFFLSALVCLIYSKAPHQTANAIANVIIFLQRTVPISPLLSTMALMGTQCTPHNINTV